MIELKTRISAKRGHTLALNARPRVKSVLVTLAASLLSGLLLIPSAPAGAQQAVPSAGVQIRGTIDPPQPPTQSGSAQAPAPTSGGLPGSTLLPPAASTAPAAVGAKGRLQLSAQLVSDGQQISSGLIWRIYQLDRRREPTLVITDRTATPTVPLPAGSYMVVGSFGRAYLTQRVDLAGGEAKVVSLVLNAGGLRVTTSIERGGAPSPGLVSYDIFADERDQSGQRVKVVSGLKPGPIIRLNSGLYHLVSRLGDANATVSSDITVEAGKLSEAKVIHQAAKVTFRLVARAGGEAIADTQWVIVAGTGGIVKETAGALPTHIVAPGTYTVSATSRGRMYQREFAVNTGDNMVVELLAK